MGPPGPPGPKVSSYLSCCLFTPNFWGFNSAVDLDDSGGVVAVVLLFIHPCFFFPPRVTWD